ncbi:calmodulin-dependent protein kinase [Pelomyxa schiedti]|nr:calmodulin-dependent protein kinase [Pelomyxa schiedti]
MMMEALVHLQVGDIDTALALVANANSLFQGECHEYLPGLLFLVCLRHVINDHESLHQHIPTCLSLAFSRAISFSTEDMRAHCMRVLSNCSHNNMEVVSEWTDLVSTASLRGIIDHDQRQSLLPTTVSSEKLWSCMYFVALWGLYCCSDNHSSTTLEELGESCDDERRDNNPITSSVGKIHWCASSVNSLGNCYDFGVGGVKKDIHKAVTLYQRAADAGHATAMFNFGSCFYHGKSVDKDINKAVRLWQTAFDAGQCTSMNNLACCYLNGIGVDQDHTKAVALYQRAADAGNINAMRNLGVCYERGNGVERDPSKAVTLFQRAADAGDSDSMTTLGSCYQDGHGVQKDINKAVNLFQRASDAGCARAMCNLGVCYYTGDGVEEDIPKALRLYQRAADAGSAAALSNLAWCYKEGTDGFSKDRHQAMRLWLLSAHLGHPDAATQLKILQSQGTKNNT